MSNNLLIVSLITLGLTAILSLVGVYLAAYLRFQQISCKYTIKWSRHTQKGVLIGLAMFGTLPALVPITDCVAAFTEVCLQKPVAFTIWFFMVSVPAVMAYSKCVRAWLKPLTKVSQRAEAWRLARVDRACKLKCQQCRKLIDGHPENYLKLLQQCSVMDEVCPEKFRHLSFVMNDGVDLLVLAAQAAMKRRRFGESRFAKLLASVGLLDESNLDTWLDFSLEEQQLLEEALNSERTQSDIAEHEPDSGTKNCNVIQFTLAQHQLAR